MVDAVEAGVPLRPDARDAVLIEGLRLDTRGVTSFFFASFDRRLFNLLVVAAAVEFCDRCKRRPGCGWSRAFDVRVAVHDPKLWSDLNVTALLEETPSFFTGDVWRFRFEQRRKAEPDPVSARLPLPPYRALIMPIGRSDTRTKEEARVAAIARIDVVLEVRFRDTASRHDPILRAPSGSAAAAGGIRRRGLDLEVA